MNAKTKKAYIKYAIDHLCVSRGYFKYQKHLSETVIGWNGHKTAHFSKKIRALDVAIPAFQAAFIEGSI